MSINKYNSTSGQLERIDSIIATDATPTSGSTNPVQSGGVYTALAGKQDILTFDATPTSASSNPVTSGGLYTALGTKANESMIGDAWDSSTTYGVAGNTSGYPVYCINNNVLYKCIQEHTGAAYEPPHASYWEATDVNTEISALNNSLTDLKHYYKIESLSTNITMTAWGGIYNYEYSLDISDLGITDPIKYAQCEFISGINGAGQSAYFCSLYSITNTTADIYLYRGTNSTILIGNICLDIYV